MTDPVLIKKIRFKEVQKSILINAPDHFIERLSDNDINTEIPQEKDKFEFILLFVANQKELNHFGAIAFSALENDGLLWVAYPKKTGKIKTDLTRDKGWDILKDFSLTGISIISLDETWSALRLGKVKGGTSGMLDDLYKEENEKLKPLYSKVEKFVLALDEKITLKQRKNYSPFYFKRQFMAVKPHKGKLIIGLRMPDSLIQDFPETNINQFKLNESLNLAIVILAETEFNSKVKEAIQEAFQYK